MIDVLKTDEFLDWLVRLRDTRARARIQIRIDRLESGLFGDAKFFEGIGELRIDYGPGYRLYFVRRGATVVVLLCGGDKSSQRNDIEQQRDWRRMPTSGCETDQVGWIGTPQNR